LSEETSGSNVNPEYYLYGGHYNIDTIVASDSDCDSESENESFDSLETKSESDVENGDSLLWSDNRTDQSFQS
jgi:hypothetical protein